MTGRDGTAAQVLVRASTLADLSAGDMLLQRSYRQLLKSAYPPSVMVMAVPLIARAQPDLLSSGTYFVAETADGRVVGAGGWSARGPGAKHRRQGWGHVRHFATDVAFVRQGVGAALMARVVATASEAGLTALDCLSTRTAVPFYLSQKFRTLGDVTVGLRPGIVFPAIQLHRPLR